MGMYSWDEFWEDVKDAGGVAVGIGSAVALGCGGVEVPGGNIVLWGGVLWGFGSAGDLINRHWPDPSGPPAPRGECMKGCHREPGPAEPDPHGLPPGTGCRGCHVL